MRSKNKLKRIRQIRNSVKYPFWRYAWSFVFAIISIKIFTAFPIGAQPATVPFRTIPYNVDTGIHQGVTNEPFLAFSQTIQQDGAAWLRLHFGSYDLSEHSYLILTSLKDGGRQRMNAETFEQWRNWTAFFNGDAVQVELYVAPGENGIYARIEEIIAGERVKRSPPGDIIVSLCGDDDRIASDDGAVGRIDYIIGPDTAAGCTGWIVSNGAHLTAGHCIDPDMDILEFNVPPSLDNGTPQFADPDDQYAVDAASITFNYDGDANMGNDWAVFNCFANPNTGLLPVQAQGSFYRMSRDDSPSIARVTGYGADDEPPGSNGGRNAQSQTEQTNSGSYLGETIEGASDVIIEYIVDTAVGNSGSPVMNTSNSVTIGIHTNAGCDPPNDGNHGTGFENDALENAIQIFPGSNVVYVDASHPVVFENGTILRPFNTVQEGANAVITGGKISIVTGSYNEAVTITRAMRLKAPVGSVVIGQ